MAKASRQFADLKNLRDGLRRDQQTRLEHERLLAEQAARTVAEAALFENAVQDVVPLAPPNRARHARIKPAPLPRHTQADEKQALLESLSDEFNAETLLETDDTLSWRRDGLGADVVRKLRRGTWVLEGQIDLHGARTDEAREQLALFLRDSIKRGLRCVRVVHGKGLGSAGGMPVLKGKVRSWLMQKEEVLAFCQARAQDGGSGALLVLLKSASG